MNSERIKMLEQFVIEGPHDPFNQYALGLELAKSDQGQAKKVFDRLIAAHPTYLPAYYQTALLYIELSLSAEAKQIIEAGIALAEQQLNAKTLNELRGLLDDL